MRILHCDTDRQHVYLGQILVSELDNKVTGRALLIYANNPDEARQSCVDLGVSQHGDRPLTIMVERVGTLSEYMGWEERN